MTDWGKYDEFIAAAEKDNREGDHEAVVTAVTPKNWPSGDPFWQIEFGLVDAGMAKTDIALNRLPTPEDCEVVKQSGNRSRMRGVALTLNIYKQLEQHYGVTDPTEIQPGQVYFVKCVKDRVDPVTKKGGFVRVRAFLPKGSASKEAQQASEIPF